MSISPLSSHPSNREASWRLSHWRRECRSTDLPLPTLAKTELEYLSLDTPFPHVVDFKDFIRYNVIRMKGVLTPLPTVDSIKTNLESFFSGFWRRTGTYYANEDRTEFYKVGRPTWQSWAPGPLTSTVCQASSHGRRPVCRHPAA